MDCGGFVSAGDDDDDDEEDDGEITSAGLGNNPHSWDHAGGVNGGRYFKFVFFEFCIF